MNRFHFLCIFLLASLFCAAQTTSSVQADEAAAKKVPVIDGAAGSCSLELTVNTADSKPVYAASVKVHIAYGFGGMRKLDLEASTNIDGKVKFTGIPVRVRRPPLEFKVSKDQLSAIAKYDPETECKATQTIMLEKSKFQ